MDQKDQQVESSGDEIGKVVHFYDKINVGVIHLTKGGLKVGDLINIKGHNDFEQKVESIQVDHQEIQEAKQGEEVGLKLDQTAHEGDLVYKIK